MRSRVYKLLVLLLALLLLLLYSELSAVASQVYVQLVLVAGAVLVYVREDSDRYTSIIVLWHMIIHHASCSMTMNGQTLDTNNYQVLD